MTNKIDSETRVLGLSAASGVLARLIIVVITLVGYESKSKLLTVHATHSPSAEEPEERERGWREAGNRGRSQGAKLTVEVEGKISWTILPHLILEITWVYDAYINILMREGWKILVDH